jgi:ChaB protein
VGVSTASPRRSLPFQCADDASSILGAHDGISSWMLHVGRERSGPEQRFVSAHERLHHELHSTTPWGFVMSVVGGQVTPQARMAWRWLAESCRTTHEVFATYFAVLLDDTNPQLLAGNRVYQGYQAVGEELRTMPRSRRYNHLSPAGELPGTVQRSSPEAKEAFRQAREDAVRVYGKGDLADRAAYATLKKESEKCGDHWIAKSETVA